MNEMLRNSFAIAYNNITYKVEQSDKMFVRWENVQKFLFLRTFFYCLPFYKKIIQGSEAICVGSKTRNN